MFTISIVQRKDGLVSIIRGLFTLIGYTGPTARRLAEGWRELIDEVGGVGNGGMIMHYAHSLGGVETARARRLMTPEEQKMIRVTTFGSPKVLSDEGFLKCVTTLVGTTMW